MDRKPPAYLALAQRIAEEIRSGRYRANERVPSVRQLSRQRKISPTTVIRAYLVLQTRGLVEARPQSGYYVCDPRRRSLPQILRMSILC